jgi:predicted lysophospholipase L1 biosynthesis ABC-type transport system permease subunit
VDIAASVIETQGNELILHDNKQRFMPLWALLTIIVGAVAVAGGVAVLFIVKRKRQR